MTTIYALILYSAKKIDSIVCMNCATDDERNAHALPEAGSWPITAKGLVICDRCGKVCE
jgi:hypothetical protein